MRSGQSKQKGPITAEQNRLMRTQGPSRPSNFLENTEIPNSTKRIESNRQIARSKTKVEFNIEDHMTESRIQQAKAGLQLLKKKSRNHDRPASIQRKEQKQDLYSRKSIINQGSNIDIEPFKGNPALQSKIPKQKGLNTTGNKRPSEKEYSNSIQEAPIAPKKKDFMALLEEEMQKENKGMQPVPVPKNTFAKPANSDPSEYPDENSALIQCTRGCGRMFNEKAIQKHEKICDKVFQSKRKAFNSAAFRQVEEVEKQPSNSNKMMQTQMSSIKGVASKKKSSKQVVKQGTKEKIPKWKLESLQFRAGLQSSSGKQLSKEEKAILEQNSGLVQCQYCMRKFNAKAGQRHIEFCETKSKQMPKMNVSIKRK